MNCREAEIGIVSRPRFVPDLAVNQSQGLARIDASGRAPVCGPDPKNCATDRYSLPCISARVVHQQTDDSLFSAVETPGTVGPATESECFFFLISSSSD